jgi:hypothetical protein
MGNGATAQDVIVATNMFARTQAAWAATNRICLGASQPGEGYRAPGINGGRPPILLPRLGDLSPREIAAIQGVVNQAGRPLEVVGSAARAARKPTSDIDYIAPPNSIPYFQGLSSQLPRMDQSHGIIPGYGNPNQGPVIRFEPR